jgi:hypothetical protein
MENLTDLNINTDFNESLKLLVQMKKNASNLQQERNALLGSILEEAYSNDQNQVTEA